MGPQHQCAARCTVAAGLLNACLPAGTMLARMSPYAGHHCCHAWQVLEEMQQEGVPYDTLTHCIIVDSMIVKRHAKEAIAYAQQMKADNIRWVACVLFGVPRMEGLQAFQGRQVRRLETAHPQAVCSSLHGHVRQGPVHYRQYGWPCLPLKVPASALLRSRAAPALSLYRYMYQLCAVWTLAGSEVGTVIAATHAQTDTLLPPNPQQPPGSIRSRWRQQQTPAADCPPVQALVRGSHSSATVASTAMQRAQDTAWSGSAQTLHQPGYLGLVYVC